MSRRSTGGVAEEQAPAWDADPLIGRVIDGRYRVEDILGTGGVGVVYRAEHLKLQRQVAVKVLHEKLGNIDELRRRFEREAQALSALSHPNVVSVTDYGISDGMPYLVMELLDGRTLADLIDDDGPPRIELAIEILREILRGLSFAHEKGIVHRDLKAANVFLQVLPDAPHHVKLLDFGLAKIFTTEEGSSDPTLTKSGTILGTPAYMPPEQATGSTVDERADVYSAGVLFYEMLTGRYPYEAPTRAEMLRAHLLSPLPDPEAARAGLLLSPELRDFLSCAMQKERQHRHPNAAAMLAALDALPNPAATFDPHAGSGEVSRGALRSDAPTVVSSEASEAGAVAASDSQKPLSRMLPLVVVAAGVVLLGLAALLLFGGEGPEEPDDGTGQVIAPPNTGETEGAGQDETESSGALGGEEEDLEASELGAEEGSDVVEAEADDVVDEELLGDLVPGAIGEAWPAASDPYATPMPRSLRRYHRKVRAGRRLSARDRRAVQQMQRALPEDPRPSLILAHNFVEVTFFTDALERYEQAVNIDPSARGDRRMLPDLIRIAQSRSDVGDRAADLIVRVYGPEAIGPVEAAIVEQSDPVRVGVLTSLLSRLPASRGE